MARYQRYGADVRRDVAHKTSHTLAVDPRYKLFVFEALKVKNMTKKAKPKQDELGRWLRNGAAAKSGLNKAILASTWGQTKVFLQYKTRRQGKLVIEVPAFILRRNAAHAATFTRTTGFRNPSSSVKAVDTSTMQTTTLQKSLPCVVSSNCWLARVSKMRKRSAGSQGIR